MSKPIQAERHVAILDMVTAERVVRVEDLAEGLGVSENTIRRDLAVLEQEGRVRRTKGGAVLNQSDRVSGTFTRRLSAHRERKTRIAEAAMAYIEEGATVILDAGTTTYELALLLHGWCHLTVVTNSVAVADALDDAEGVTVVVSGGILHRPSRALVGPPAESFFADVHADTVFLAPAGVSAEVGLTDHNMQETPVKQRMIASACRVVVLADSGKLGRSALSLITPIAAEHTIITDTEADSGRIHELQQLGCTLIEA